MESGTAIALGVVAIVIVAGLYLATRPPAGQLGGGLGGGALPAGPQAEGAQYITAVGGAIGSVLGGVGSLYSNIGRQAGGTSAGGAK